ncbi:MbtH family NRPS accessory protein (plasmid) [Streptomyces sp. NBC_00335]|uniref:MbtH family protein n=1 Tax=unclassified Streptomyces TaxID=2593676 RepID=UPI00225B3085|nr:MULTISPECIES: MbtH family NRPS accessory protein [unclassified Streptomyces]MCX5410111.1 MbtH family NRPS accessory protein [Streptomyces sp. NBC_00086]
MSEQQSAPAAFRVVHNDEEQFSVWWADRDLPAGWHAEGTEGSREECLAHIDEIWTDMRPASLRRRMAEQAAG